MLKIASLRSQVIRLAHEKPGLRSHLLPLLREASEDWRGDLPRRKAGRDLAKSLRGENLSDLVEEAIAQGLEIGTPQGTRDPNYRDFLKAVPSGWKAHLGRDWLAPVPGKTAKKSPYDAATKAALAAMDKYRRTGTEEAREDARRAAEHAAERATVEGRANDAKAHLEAAKRLVEKRAAKQAADPTPRDVSDEEILNAAREIAKQDPKKRFSIMGVRRLLAERDGTSYIIVKGPSLERRVEDLVRQRKIVPDRTRGLFLFPKSVAGQGVEFQNSGGGALEILVNGESVGEIRPSDGEMIGATRTREKGYEIDLWMEKAPAMPPSFFKKLLDAKAWVKQTFSR